MSQLSKTDIEYLADLARIELVEDEKEELAAKLGSVLSYVGEIQNIATNTTAMSHAGDLRNVVREDAAPNPGGEFTEMIVANAPKTENGYVQVRRIM